jgi:hypothetical protein
VKCDLHIEDESLGKEKRNLARSSWTCNRKLLNKHLQLIWKSVPDRKLFYFASSRILAG